MKSILPAIALVLGTVLAAFAADAKKVVPHPVTVTYYVSHVECSSCVETIKDAVLKLPSVTDVDLTEDQPYARIKFDSHVVSYHQIAQAILSSEPGAEKYAPLIKLRIPDYAKGENAGKIDAIFARHKDQVRVEPISKDKGEFKVVFLPLKTNAAAKGPQGWNMGKFWHPIHDAPPAGLGLAISTVSEGK
jgi:copper chaperone CopZ